MKLTLILLILLLSGCYYGYLPVRVDDFGGTIVDVGDARYFYSNAGPVCQITDTYVYCW